ncbi:MAG: dihydroorotase [Algoriphagus sp.]|uniref:dihydroorotase n=1 Tax=Algoriphagus sp. TaxID=1872435 RepID=UPI00263126BC|nr:dihydroorotase [Algoriphagus sp.]MDG1276838.1 dihydroorotase [Algoriphagus sp.]
MSILFRGLRLVNSNGLSQPKDYVFENGELTPVTNSYSSEFKKEINADGWLLSAGWIDLRCSMGEPGHEYKESIESLADSLVSGGFCAAVIQPNTQPTIQSKGDVEYILNRAKQFTPEFVIQGAVTKDTAGEDFTEILDMNFQSGVKIFGEGVKPLSNGDRFMKVNQYLQKFDGILFDHSYDPLLAIFGQMHEGENSTMLGIKGIPNLAEDVAVQRNIEILKYTGGRVHFQTVSSAKSVDLIRKAKAEGLRVTSDVSIYQLIFSDHDLMDFDPNLKVLPPFRGDLDRKALIEGLKDGTIDAIVSNHQPEDFDSKFMEFDLAHFGMAGLQTFLPALVKLEAELGWVLLIDKITKGPRTILPHQLQESWTIFDPECAWTYNEKTNKSLSSNNPWFGKELNGKVKYVIQKSQLIKVDV